MWTLISRAGFRIILSSEIGCSGRYGNRQFRLNWNIWRRSWSRLILGIRPCVSLLVEFAASLAYLFGASARFFITLHRWADIPSFPYRFGRSSYHCSWSFGEVRFSHSAVWMRNASVLLISGLDRWIIVSLLQCESVRRCSVRCIVPLALCLPWISLRRCLLNPRPWCGWHNLWGNLCSKKHDPQEKLQAGILDTIFLIEGRADFVWAYWREIDRLRWNLFPWLSAPEWQHATTWGYWSAILLSFHHGASCR